MNRYMTEKWPWIEGTHQMRSQFLDILNDADLTFNPGGQNMTLGALCRQLGEVEHSYAQSLKTFQQDWVVWGGGILAVALGVGLWLLNVTRIGHILVIALGDGPLMSLTLMPMAGIPNPGKGLRPLHSQIVSGRETLHL